MKKINEKEKELFRSSFLNAVLSLKVYLNSIDEFNEKKVNGNTFTPSEIREKGKNYVFAHYLSFELKDKFKPVNLFENKEKIFNEVNVKQNDGIYELLNKDEFSDKLDEEKKARFSLGLFETELDGEKKLHVVFRGTDPKYNNKIEYFLYDYINMKRHYNVFKPILKEAMEYAKINNIKNIDVAGHSLGGAMTDLFVKEIKEQKQNVNIKGYTYGNPFGEQSLQWLMDGFDSIKNKIQKTKNPMFHKIAGIINVPPVPLLIASAVVNGAYNYLTLIKSLINTKKIDEKAEYVAEPSDVLSINNVNDPVVKAGALLFKTNGNRVILKENHSENFEALPIGDAFMFNHSMTNYIHSFIKRMDSFGESEFTKKVKEVKEQFDKLELLSKINEIRKVKVNTNAQYMSALANNK